MVRVVRGGVGFKGAKTEESGFKGRKKRDRESGFQGRKNGVRAETRPSRKKKPTEPFYRHGKGEKEGIWEKGKGGDMEKGKKEKRGGKGGEKGGKGKKGCEEAGGGKAGKMRGGREN